MANAAFRKPAKVLAPVGRGGFASSFRHIALLKVERGLLV
jgi:hypothetical protein